MKYMARRVGAGVTVDVIFARSTVALGGDGRLKPTAPGTVRPSIRVSTVPSTPTAVPTLAPTPVPSPLESPSTPPAPEPTEVPSEVSTAQPLGPEVSPSAPTSPAPSPSASPIPQEQKITDVSVAELPNGTRITLTLTGPVSFEWHRLLDPDNRYWLDISHATLIGAAQTLQSKLPFVKEIKISQHQLVPDKVVRLSITPTQSIDVRIGGIEGSPNQLGIEIENQPPPPDAPTTGIGSLITVENASPGPVRPAPTQPNLIVVDHGHGGNDPGSINPAYGLTESKLTLAIAQRLAEDLRHQGWQVTLTRDGDYEVGDPAGPDKQELQARCDVANAAGARLFVSIHINSSMSSAPNGTTTYYWHSEDRAFAAAVQNATVAADGITDDGIKRYSFFVIHHTVMPSILVETAYLSNPHDADLLRQLPFLDRIAAGIARGIGDFTGGPQTPVGQSRSSRNTRSQRKD
jgi:N-acetylmuramoyl-L-alanine amidase